MTREVQNSTKSKTKITLSACCTAGYCFLCAAFSLIAAVLFLSIIFIILDVPHGFEALSLRILIRDAFAWAVLPLVAYVGDIFKSLFPWPILVIFAVALVVWGPDRVREFVSSLKFEFGDFKFDATATAPDAFKRELGDAQRITTKTNKEIEQAYAAAKEYVVQLRARYQIDALVGELSIQIAKAIGERCPEDFRLTVYVPDLVFENQLYQLVEYHDKYGKRISDDRTGRTFSIRYGIIGRVWRSGVPEVEDELLSAEDQKLIKNTSDIDEVERFIARRWGLTLYEAARVRPYQSYGAIRIERGGGSPGLIYFDSREKSAFDGSNIQGVLSRIIQESELSLGLVEVNREVSQFLRIRIFESR